MRANGAMRANRRMRAIVSRSMRERASILALGALFLLVACRVTSPASEDRGYDTAPDMVPAIAPASASAGTDAAPAAPGPAANSAEAASAPAASARPIAPASLPPERTFAPAPPLANPAPASDRCTRGGDPGFGCPPPD
jgi:hypothetical protein